MIVLFHISTYYIVIILFLISPSFYYPFPFSDFSLFSLSFPLLLGLRRRSESSRPPLNDPLLLADLLMAHAR